MEKDNKKFKDTKVGKWVAEKLPDVADTLGGCSLTKVSWEWSSAWLRAILDCQQKTSLSLKKTGRRTRNECSGASDEKMGG